MAIRVKCGHCSAEFQAKPEHAGKRGKCPKCGAAVVVPSAPGLGASRSAAPATAATPARQGSPAAQGAAAGTCPSCGKGLPPNAVICVRCGLDLRSGRQVAARPDAVASTAAPAAAAVKPSPKPRTSSAAGQCPTCDNPMPPGLTVCSVCGYDVGKKGQSLRLRSENRPKLSAEVLASANWGLVKAGLRLMCYSAIAQFLAGLWFALTLGTPLIVVLVASQWTSVLLLFAGAAALKAIVQYSELDAIGIAVYVASWLYVVALAAALFTPVGILLVIAVGLVFGWVAMFAGVTMLVGLIFSALVPVRWHLRMSAFGALACLGLSAAGFVSALGAGVWAVRSEIAATLPGTGKAAPAMDSTAPGDTPTDTQTAKGAPAKLSEAAQAAFAWAVGSLGGGMMAAFVAYLLIVLHLRGFAEFLGDEATATEAKTFLWFAITLIVIAVISAVLTVLGAVANVLAIVMLVVVLAFSVAAGVLFFRLVRGVHDLVAMVT